MSELIKCAALVAFTRFVSAHGMVHGDPDSTDKAAKNPMVPVHKVSDFHAEGLIKAPKAFLDKLAADAETEAVEVAQVELDARIAVEDAAAAVAADAAAGDGDDTPPA